MKGRARLHAQLAFALLLAWTACERGSRGPVAAARIAPAVVFVSASLAESPDADGSARRPFAGPLGSALAPRARHIPRTVRGPEAGRPVWRRREPDAADGSDRRG